MRVLFASWATAGHLAPLVPLGWALRAAGHEVLVATHPSWTDPIIRAGLPAVPVGPELDMPGLLRARRRGAARGYAGMLETAEAVADVLADDLVAFSREWRPDLVVFEPAAIVGPLVARLLGVPAVRQLWTSDFTAPVTGFPATVTGLLAERFGLAEFDTTGDLTLDPCPPSLQVVDDLARQPVRYIPYNGAAVLADWLDEPPGRRRVCVTWGTSMHGLGAHRTRHLPRVVRALGELDAELVLAVPDEHRDLFTDLPANVRAVGQLPLHLLLPSCDAIIHQGGGGTLMTALACGVPQVVVPSMADQTYNAGHLVATGAGIGVYGGDDVAASDVLAAAVEVLNNPRYRRAAADLHAEQQTRPTPAEVVPVLERLAAKLVLAVSR